MPVALMILLQATSPAPGASSGIDFDLSWVTNESSMQLGIDTPCASTDPDVIVVCGDRNDEHYRLRSLPAGDFEAGPVDAEIRLGRGMIGGIEMDSVAMPNGFVSKRVMVKITKEF